MKFDNENTVVRIQALKTIYAIIVLSFIGLLYVTNLRLFIETHLGLSDVWVIMILLAAYFSFYFYHLIVNTSYLFFSDDGLKIIIRFYPLRPINPKKYAYEIPKNQFLKFSYNKTRFREEVVVYQRIGSKVSKYPPFSLKGLSKEQKAKLFVSLQSYSQEPE